MQDEDAWEAGWGAQEDEPVRGGWAHRRWGHRLGTGVSGGQLDRSGSGRWPSS